MYKKHWNRERIASSHWNSETTWIGSAGVMILLLVLSPGTECTLCAAVLTTLCLLATLAALWWLGTLWWEGVGLPGAVWSALRSNHLGQRVLRSIALGTCWPGHKSCPHPRGCSSGSHERRYKVTGKDNFQKHEKAKVNLAQKSINK